MSRRSRTGMLVRTSAEVERDPPAEIHTIRTKCREVTAPLECARCGPLVERPIVSPVTRVRGLPNRRDGDHQPMPSQDDAMKRIDDMRREFDRRLDDLETSFTQRLAALEEQLPDIATQAARPRSRRRGTRRCRRVGDRRRRQPAGVEGVVRRR